jgi:hypothetical protein
VVAGLLPSPFSGGYGLHRERERVYVVERAHEWISRREIKGIRCERASGGDMLLSPIYATRISKPPHRNVFVRR